MAGIGEGLESSFAENVLSYTAPKAIPGITIASATSAQGKKLLMAENKSPKPVSIPINGDKTIVIDPGQQLQAFSPTASDQKKFQKKFRTSIDRKKQIPDNYQVEVVFHSDDALAIKQPGLYDGEFNDAYYACDRNNGQCGVFVLGKIRKPSTYRVIPNSGSLKPEDILDIGTFPIVLTTAIVKNQVAATTEFVTRQTGLVRYNQAFLFKASPQKGLQQNCSELIKASLPKMPSFSFPKKNATL